MSNVKTREIKTKFSIEGEKQLKTALSENAAQAKELKSEMALLDAKFADATDSEDYLSQKAEILAKQIENAEDKVSLYDGALDKAIEQQNRIAEALEESRRSFEQQEKAVQDAIDAYGEDSEEVQKLNEELEYSRKVIDNQEAQLSKANKTVSQYQTSTNYAQAAVEKLSKQTDKGTKSIKKLEDSTKDAAGENSKLSDITGKLADKLGFDLPDGASLATGSMGAVSAGVGAGITVFKAYIETLSAVIQKMVEISVEAGQWAVELEKLSAQTGMSTERIQQLGFAAEQSGVEVEKIADSTKDLAQALAAAEDPTSEEAEMFRKLGINAKNADGSIRSAGELWEPVMERLSRIKDRTEQAAIANKLLGDSYFDLLPFLQDYTKFMSDANSETAQNSVLSDEEIKTLTDVNAAYLKLSNSIEHVKRAMATQAAEDLIEAMDEMRNVVNELGEYLLDSGAVESLGKYVEFLAKMVNFFLVLSDMPGVERFFNIVNGAIDLMTDGLEIITKLLDKIISQSDDVATALLGPLGTLISGVGNNIYKNAKGYASGTPYAQGGIVRVGEYGPETVYLPRGSSVDNARNTAASRTAAAPVYITVNANVPDLETLQQIIEFYKNYEVTRRMG